VSETEQQETARQRTEAMWSRDAVSKTLGLELGPAGPGHAEVTMTVRPDMVNGWSVCHGGLIATLADSAFAVACNYGEHIALAAGFDIIFLEPGRLGDRLVARAREVVLRGRSGIYDVTVTREQDEVVLAEFRGRSRTTARLNQLPAE
jgi:acyl-CoA thioesterase